MPRQAATTGSLPRAFEGVKEMQAGGPDRGEGCRPLGRQAPDGINECRDQRGPGSSRAEWPMRWTAGATPSTPAPLTCFRCRTLAGRTQVGTTSAIERRFREVRRRTRPMGTFQDRTSTDRIIHAVFMHDNRSRGIRYPTLNDT